MPEEGEAGRHLDSHLVPVKDGWWHAHAHIVPTCQPGTRSLSKEFTLIFIETATWSSLERRLLEMI